MEVVFLIFQVAGSLMLFIYGMKVMSDGIQRAAGVQLRNTLNKVTSSKFRGVMTGLLTTSVIQSSSATTVMTVSFVNAGIITPLESVGLIMGANIGTTITAWIVSGIGYKIALSSLVLPLLVIGVPLLLRNKGKSRYWGEFIIGFSLLFMGLYYLRQSIPDVNQNATLFAWLRQYSGTGFLSILAYVMIGGFITAIIQSSSAAIALTITMCMQGWLPFELGAAMVLGENIGTTVTAELAALVGNFNARITARVHSIFNILGVLWMLLLMPYFLPFISKLCDQWFHQGDAFVQAEARAYALSLFHTSFNCLNTLVQISFSGFLVKLATSTLRVRLTEDEVPKLRFIRASYRTPELAIVELHKEVAHFTEVTSRMNGFLRSLINNYEPKKQDEFTAKLIKYEGITDKMEIELVEYATTLAEQEMTVETSIKLRSFIKVCNDLEKIGDIYYQMTLEIERKRKDRTWFSPYQRTKLNLMLNLVEKAFKNLIANISKDLKDVTLDEAKEIQNEIKELQRDLTQSFEEFNSSDQDNDFNLKGTLIFEFMANSLEKIGSNILSINENAKGEI
ncbi:MAG: Na/Pi cotransporter family protein [Saprospiraceae bacterium]|nr:Na/Pi cotransporter family protein [Saprospiraceae bacterium]